ncbi:hypothetical protein EMCRGX_G016109 [Ephydatia muelleri]
MSRLHEQLKYFVNQKLNSDPSWQRLKVILSGHVMAPFTYPSPWLTQFPDITNCKVETQLYIPVSPMVLLLAVCRDSNWCFSPAAIAQLDMFISRFPRMFEYLNSNPKDDMYYEADLFPEPDGCTSLSPSVASGLKAGHQPGVLEATANIWIGSQWIASQIATIETVVPDMQGINTTASYSHLINEGDQHHSLPFLLLSIQANDKFHRIEALQYKVLIQHQALVCPGEEGLAGRRQHCQQLLVGQERGAQLKLHVEAIACIHDLLL